MHQIATNQPNEKPSYIPLKHQDRSHVTMQQVLSAVWVGWSQNRNFGVHHKNRKLHEKINPKKTTGISVPLVIQGFSMFILGLFHSDVMGVCRFANGRVP